MCPIVSVIIPTYNRSGMLKQAILSVLAQTFNNIEVVIVDDGSSDETRDVISNIKDSRIKYIYQENAGLSAARNTGIRFSQGNYIAFLDDDDLWFPMKLESQLPTFEKNPDIGLVTCGYQYISEDGQTVKEIRPWLWRPALNLETWLFACPTIINAVVVRREWLDRVKAFNLQLASKQDWDLYLRLSHAGCKMVWVEEVLCAYRIHDRNMVRDVKQTKIALPLILDNFYSMSDLSESILALKDKAYSKAFLRIAARAIGVGNEEIARDHLVMAIDRDPSLLTDHGEPIINFILDYMNDPLVAENPDKYIDVFFRSIPGSVSELRIINNKIGVYKARKNFYIAYKEKEWGRVRRESIYLISHDTKSYGRAELSITLESMIGSYLMNRARTVIRKFRRPRNFIYAE